MHNTSGTHLYNLLSPLHFRPWTAFRKAVKAAVFLLPLLGILHLLETFVSASKYREETSPSHSEWIVILRVFQGGASIVVFTMYSTVTIICRTLQGFFCSLLYCFLNAEVT